MNYILIVIYISKSSFLKLQYLVKLLHNTFQRLSKNKQPSLEPSFCSTYTDYHILYKILVFNTAYIKIVLISLRVYCIRQAK